MPAFIILAQLLSLAVYVHGHNSLIHIQGSNNLVGHAFGVVGQLGFFYQSHFAKLTPSGIQDTTGKYPRVPGPRGDAGGDSGIFQIETNNPHPSCGSTPELGPIDIVGWLSQAEGFGLPAAYANGSIVAQVFQVNRDGGGPMSCEYNEDATAMSFKPMKMILNHSGNKGVQPQERVNETVVIQFPEGAQCTGGWTQTACIIRCRTGVNKRFGGCFAAKLSRSSTVRLAIAPMGSAHKRMNAPPAQAVLHQLQSPPMPPAKPNHRTSPSLLAPEVNHYHRRPSITKSKSTHRAHRSHQKAHPHHHHHHLTGSPK